MARKMRYAYDDATGIGTFTPLGGDAEAAPGVESFSFNIHDYAPAIQTPAQGRGFAVVFQDCYAGIREPGAMTAAMIVRHTAMIAGEWTAKGEGGSRITDLARDVATATGNSLDDVVTELAKLSKDERKALKEYKDVKLATTARKKIEANAADKAAKKAAESADDEDAPTAVGMFAGLKANAES